MDYAWNNIWVEFQVHWQRIVAGRCSFQYQVLPIPTQPPKTTVVICRAMGEPPPGLPNLCHVATCSLDDIGKWMKMIQSWIMCHQMPSRWFQVAAFTTIHIVRLHWISMVWCGCFFFANDWGLRGMKPATWNKKYQIWVSSCDPQFDFVFEMILESVFMCFSLFFIIFQCFSLGNVPTVWKWGWWLLVFMIGCFLGLGDGDSQFYWAPAGLTPLFFLPQWKLGAHIPTVIIYAKPASCFWSQLSAMISNSFVHFGSFWIWCSESVQVFGSEMFWKPWSMFWHKDSRRW